MMQRNKNNDVVVRHTFRTYERIKRQKDIDTLFFMGKAYSVFPILIKYLVVDKRDGELSSVKTGFSVPKKKFKHAVKRNRIKRLMREAWRLNKHTLDIIPDNKQLHLFFIYKANDVPSYPIIESAVGNCIQKLKTLAG